VDRRPAKIAKIDLFTYELTYVGGEYVMSRGRSIRSLTSTVARLTTDDGLAGYGETCPLGANYLPAHAAGARAALEEIAPHLLGCDLAPEIVSRRMDAILLGHPYAKSAIDIACWDIFGKATGASACELLGGLLQESFPLYVAIPLGPPEEMREHVARHRAAGIRRFQLKLGGAPADDAARVRAVVEATEAGDLVIGDANCGWTYAEALAAASALAGMPRFYLEQPCRTLEECFRVREHTSLPMILDEVIVDVQSLLRAWEERALEGFNLKLSRVGGLSQARVLRDLGERLGLIVNIEDSWGGDLTTAAVSHLAASTGGETLGMVSFMNDWTNEHLAGYHPRSRDGVGAAPTGPGLGIEVDPTLLGEPVASF
jgi:L-alanine-DL-glutamate epimerase-like enolase superfamily enzyme